MYKIKHTQAYLDCKFDCHTRDAQHCQHTTNPKQWHFGFWTRQKDGLAQETDTPGSEQILPPMRKQCASGAISHIVSYNLESPLFSQRARALNANIRNGSTHTMSKVGKFGGVDRSRWADNGRHGALCQNQCTNSDCVANARFEIDGDS